MTIPSYITAQDLVDSLSEPVYMAIYDDVATANRTTVDASTGVGTVLGRSCAWIESWLPDIYKKMPPSTGAAGVPAGGDLIPRLMKDAQLQYAVILSYRRHPEYVKTYGATPGGKLMEELKELMARIQSGTQRISPNDTPPEPTPQNVGGVAVADGARIAMSNPDGSSNLGDW